MNTKIAKARPFEGKPVINAASVFGAGIKKEFLYKIPVTGKRPISLRVEGLREGMSFENGIISGKILEDSEFEIKVYAENELGYDEKGIIFKIFEDSVLLTPLLGFTSWNAFGSAVTQDDMLNTAKHIKESGLMDYGYHYINTDSGWQKEYGGKFDAIMPNDKFPDMKKMCDSLHEMGFKCGIYTTPMLTAWGCPEEFEWIPGCTRGEPDIRFSDTNGGIGVERMEENNAKQLGEWGFDYLKYDWTPTDAYNADFMKQALLKLERQVAFCVTVHAHIGYSNYWSTHCCSWRSNEDSRTTWSNLVERMDTVDKWKEHVKPGHFYDLDMLEIGKQDLFEGVTLTEDEELFGYTMRAFFASPIQLSCRIDEISEFQFNMICNDEIIRINQDSLADYPERIKDYDLARVYKRKLENGDIAIAVFNMNDQELNETLDLDGKYQVRDVWAREDLECTDSLSISAATHGVRVYRLKKV